MNYIVTNGFSELNNDEIINVDGGRSVVVKKVTKVVGQTLIVLSYGIPF